MVRFSPPLGSAPARSNLVSVQRVINMMAQKAPEGSPWPFWLVGAPGLKTFVTLPKAPVRAAAVFNDALYAIGGDTLYKIAADGAITTYAAVSIPDGQIYMAPGNGFLVWTAGGNGYWHDGTLTARITDLDFPEVTSVDYLDGYWLFSQADTGKFVISSINDPKTYNALDFASAESQPDNLKRLIVTHREVWLFGGRSTEIWTDTGNADFPFERYNPASVDRGIMSGASAAVLDNTIFWLGDDGLVYRAEGYTPTAISTPEVSKAIGDCTDKANIVGFTWSQEGHVLYALRLPGVGCWVYDASTQQWHERETFGRGMWRASCYANAYGRHYVGDDTTGGVYELDYATYTDGGGVFARKVTTPAIWAEGQRFTTHRFQADYEVGVGLTTGQGSNPQVMLRWSGDGGFTWSNEHWTSLGPIGARYQRAMWRRLGQARQRAYELVVTDPVRVAFLGMTADIEGGAV